MKSEYILLEEVADELGKTPYSIAHMLTTKDHKLYLHVEESQESQIAISTYEGIPEHLNMYEVFKSIYPLVFESQKELILRLSQGNDDLSRLNFTDDKNKISAYFVSGCSGVTVVAKKADINTLSTPPLPTYQGGAVTGSPTVPENNFFENSEKKKKKLPNGFDQLLKLIIQKEEIYSEDTSANAIWNVLKREFARKNRKFDKKGILSEFVSSTTSLGKVYWIKGKKKIKTPCSFRTLENKLSKIRKNTH